MLISVSSNTVVCRQGTDGNSNLYTDNLAAQFVVQCSVNVITVQQKLEKETADDIEFILFQSCNIT